MAKEESYGTVYAQSNITPADSLVTPESDARKVTVIPLFEFDVNALKFRNPAAVFEPV